MRRNRSTRLAYQAANCGLCRSPIDFPSGFWFDTEKALGVVHPTCMMYDLERGPVRAGSKIVQTCRDATCVNPSHLELDLTNAEWDPCTDDNGLAFSSVHGCRTASPQEWVCDHFHGVVGGVWCSHHHESSTEAEQCAGG